VSVLVISEWLGNCGLWLGNQGGYLKVLSPFLVLVQNLEGHNGGFGFCHRLSNWLPPSSSPLRPIPTSLFSANYDHTVRITSCREYHLTGLTPILNLILHLVYKWEFVSFWSKNPWESHEATRRVRARRRQQRNLRDSCPSFPLPTSQSKSHPHHGGQNCWIKQ